AGYCLSLGVRRPETVEDLRRSLDPQQFLIHQYEAGDRELAGRWVAETVARFGRIDGLVNNAAVFHGFRVDDGDEVLLDEMWEVNVKGPLRLLQAAFPYLKESGRGRVVNIVSLSGKRLKSATAAGYAMTKHAMMAFTHGVRFSGWEHGIRATAICPGYVNTEMARGLSGIQPEEMAQPDTVAELVETVLALPNSASVVEMPINCVL
ncbi:MAG: SDR family NAD(P)-dependent oxidoreductase, partial [Gammaproteobacteria bacterium]|nr:SDR family NAD(P)-dependent oxidoreductase [Gammaproteobacteria bacterium]